MNIPWLNDYEAIQHEVGSVNLPGWSCLELRGKDRAKLLNTLATNRLDDLRPGQGRETFLTDAKGHVVAHGIVLAAEESTSFSTAASQGDAITTHFHRYIIREDVQVFDRSIQTVAWYLGGRKVDAFLEGFGIPVPYRLYDHVGGELAEAPVTVCRVEMTGSIGFLLATSRDHASTVERALERAGAKTCAREAFEAARIEWGWPVDRIDISLGNFPQEVGRNDQAISFTKGCYLGQETVARIASRGHVNRRLVLVRFPSSADVNSTTLSVDGKPVGATTSVTFSPLFGCPIGLAYVRREWAEPGKSSESTIGPAEIILPRRLSTAS